MEAAPAEEAFRRARTGDAEAYGRWMSMVEIPLRRSLQRFARAVDVEAVIQETFLRMWLLAQDSGRKLEGSHASLKFSHRVARNVALEEMRRYRQDRFIELDALDDMPEGQVQPDCPDPALAQAIAHCLQRLPAKPRSALLARLNKGYRPDRELAAGLGMRGNAFLQNIVRARRLLRNCLEKQGVRLAEILP
jgi:DNA-directed RNA polymerase specialized sigma24 family protein